MTKWVFRIAAALGVPALAGLLWVVLPDSPRLALAQHSHGSQATTPAPDKPAAGGKRGVTIGMDELHRAGGVPAGWRFSWPDGDAKKGREVFAKLECHQCHEVQGESFPPVVQDPTRRGPALAGMGAHHPAEYFAESILNPNAVVVAGPGHTGADGLSVMPDYRDSLTLAETIDLVAYIRSLTGGDHAHTDAAPPAAPERVVGAYRVRLAYAGGGDGHGQHQHHQHHGAGAKPGAGTKHGGGGHLMVFVSDATAGEPVPYLPVTATIHADGTAPRAVRLLPMLGDKGFHYGADVTLPAKTRKITVAIGKPTLTLMRAAGERFARGAEVSFDWGK
ncbi:MAG TPA: iron transporter [Methylomirabilota bacterium]|nr:iron transporter [Methylomirabilota bacterium]